MPEFRCFIDHVVSQVSTLLNLVNVQLIVMISGRLKSGTTRIVGSSAPFMPAAPPVNRPLSLPLLTWVSDMIAAQCFRLNMLSSF
jgi:hypothetical protein